MIIAHDIGTSADKASLHDMTGRMIATATSAYPVDFGAGGRAEQDPELRWRAVVATTTELLDQSDVAPREIDAVGLSGQMMGAAFLGQDFAPVRPAVIWADKRAAAQAARLTAHIPAQDSYRRTGHRMSPSYSLPKVMWVQENEPEVWEKTSHICLAKDFVAHRMTGRLLTDPSDASGTGAFTQVSGTWWPEMFEAAGVSSDLFPEVMSSTTIAWGLRPRAAAELGLAVGTPVVLGGGDGPMASVGVGSLGPEDDAYISLGSSAWLATASDQPLHDPLMRTFTFNHVLRPHRLVRADRRSSAAGRSSARRAAASLCEREGSRMKLFIDSAQRELLEPLLKTGLFAGVTTNPTLLARAGVKLKELPELVTWMRADGAETVFVQAWCLTVEDYLTCAAELVDTCADVVVKVPATPAGVAAVRSLETGGVHTLLTAVYNYVTAVYNYVQVVPAIIAEATYLAPYLGRMNDAGLDGVAEIAQMQTVIDKAHAAARLLVASIRTPDQLARLAMCGVQDFTIAPKLWWELLSEPLTDAAVGVFERDARELMS